MSEHDYLGLDLDEILEGLDVMPCVFVAEREGQVVTVPPLTDEQRAREVEIFEQCKRELETRERARLLEDRAYWKARRASASTSASAHRDAHDDQTTAAYDIVHRLGPGIDVSASALMCELEEKDVLQLSAAERTLLIACKGPRWYMQRVAVSAADYARRKASHGA